MATMRLPKFFKVIMMCCAYMVMTLNADASNIRGNLEVDKSWEPVIYLSAIGSFNDFNTASFDFLVYHSPIDSMGNFEMNDLKLPKGDRIYRLHICKKNDPVSTIIIGGKDENFIHFIMNGNSEIILYPHHEKSGFQYSSIEGHPANINLFHLFALQKDLLAPPPLPSKQNREFLKEQVLEKYLSYADTSSNAIIRLLALHFINSSFEIPMIAVMKKAAIELEISDTNSPYYLAFKEQFEYLKYQSNQSIEQETSGWTWLILLLISIPVIYFSWKRMGSGKAQNKQKPSDSIQSLSIQEKKVFELLRTGASNKEISSALNIEVSTVKSHISKIYSRLEIKSRKEIVNRDWSQ